MKTGERWSSWKFSVAGTFGALCVLLCSSGCIRDRAFVEKNLLAHQAFGHNGGVEQTYRVACPDIIELDVEQRPEFAGRYEIRTDGRINLGDYGNPRIEGRTNDEAVQVIAAEIGVAPEHVRVRVAEHRSQHILIFGEVTGLQRSVPFRGPETVVDLLQRVGGITPGAAPSDVYVVRPHVGDNQRPEIFHVDLSAIVMRQDHRTNLRLQAFDQVFVGETRKAKIEKALPPWMRSVYQRVGGPQSEVRRQRFDIGN